jgi:hypothetical protein
MQSQHEAGMNIPGYSPSLVDFRDPGSYPPPFHADCPEVDTFLPRFKKLAKLLHEIILECDLIIESVASERKAQLHKQPSFANSLFRSPRLHEVSIMMVSAFEKLFQAMEYV